MRVALFIARVMSPNAVLGISSPAAANSLSYVYIRLNMYFHMYAGQKLLLLRSREMPLLECSADLIGEDGLRNKQHFITARLR